MNIEKALSQLADPKVSGKKKREIMDTLNEQTTQKQQDPLMNALIGLGVGGLAAVAGGMTGRKMAENAVKKNITSGIEGFTDVGLLGMRDNPIGPKSMKEVAAELARIKNRGLNASNNMRNGRYDDTYDFNAPAEERLIKGAPLSEAGKQQAQRRIDSGNRAFVDAATGLGAGSAGAWAGNVAPGLAGPLTMQEAVAQPPEVRAAIERVAAGTASAEDKARLKKYHEGASSTGGFVPWLGSALAGAALSIPTAFIGGPAAGRLARKYKAPIASTARGRELAGEIGFDALAGTALGGAGASMAYNALSNPYEEPF